MLGLIQVYTGKGKGKTTAAFGLGLRASGAGLDVLMIQFLKDKVDSAIPQIKELDKFVVENFGTKNLVSEENLDEKDVELVNEGFELAKDVILNKKHDLVILDEINVAVDFGLIEKESVLELLEKKPSEVEVVLTGRYCPDEFVEKADLVTNMQEVKHYFNKGIEARRGIDF